MLVRLVIAGMLMLAGGIGGYWLGQREQPQPEPVRPTCRVVSVTPILGEPGRVVVVIESVPFDDSSEVARRKAER